MAAHFSIGILAHFSISIYRVAAKRKYKWASGLYKNFNYEDKKGIAPACLPREKETG